MAELNQKAESFKHFVEKKDPKAFVVDPIKDDPSGIPVPYGRGWDAAPADRGAG